ncbi:MAG: hypothetical protein ACOX52_08555 [Verrucomicrobiota bacterium]
METYPPHRQVENATALSAGGSPDPVFGRPGVVTERELFKVMATVGRLGGCSSADHRGSNHDPY